MREKFSSPWWSRGGRWGGCMTARLGPLRCCSALLRMRLPSPGPWWLLRLPHDVHVSVSRRWEKGGDALIPIKGMLWNLPPSHFPSHPVGQNLINSHIRFREMPYTLLKLLKLNQNGSIETGGKRRNLCHPLLYSCADSMNYTCIALKTLEIP